MPAEFGGLLCFFGLALFGYVVGLLCMPKKRSPPPKGRGIPSTMKTPEAGERYLSDKTSKARIKIRKILADEVVEYEIPPLRSILRATKEEWSNWTKVD